ncbi:MAG: hypothetical protein PVSMB7_29570 [Chloroflexota bacterium]
MVKCHLRAVLLAVVAASALLTTRDTGRSVALAQQILCNAGTPISSVQQLQRIADAPAQLYCLTADIDAHTTDGWNGGRGFTPIGSFSGILDGQGHTISGLAVRAPKGVQAGLIQVLSGGIVRNLNLSNVRITGMNDVGGVAADVVSGEIANVTVSGDVRSNTPALAGVGGIVGHSTNSNILRSHNAAAVSGPGATSLGGLVGINTGGIVSTSYNSGGITSRDGSDVGGLVGDNSGRLSDSYNTGSVQASFSVAGGIAAYNFRTGIVERTYNIGSVGAVLLQGALVGLNASTQVDSSFWDATLLPNLGGIAEADVVPTGFLAGYTDAQMQQMESFSSHGWDFSHTWAIENGRSYPFLAAVSSGTVLRGDYCMQGGTSCAAFFGLKERAGWTFADVEAQSSTPLSTSAQVPQHAHIECRSVYSQGRILYQRVGIVDTSGPVYTLSGAVARAGTMAVITLAASSVMASVAGLPTPPMPFSDSARVTGVTTVDPGGNAGSGRVTRGTLQVTITGAIPTYIWKSGAWSYDRTDQSSISCGITSSLNALYDAGMTRSVPVADEASLPH